MRVVLVPGCLALLPQYASLHDPVADLRQACQEAVAWLGPDPEVLADHQGQRIAAHLIATAASHRHGSAGVDGGGGASAPGRSVLVVANGSARRTEKAPGAFDERAEAYDAALRRLLVDLDVEGLRRLDAAMAAEMWASVGALAELGEVVSGSPLTARVDYDEAPFGVQYWVIRWS